MTKKKKTMATPPAANAEGIRIGTLVSATNAVSHIPRIIQHGFESFSITFWKTLGDINPRKLAKELRGILDDTGVVISSVSIFGNPLAGDADAGIAIDGWKKLIDTAHLFGCDLVTGFAGRVVDEPIDKSMKTYRKIFTPIARRAADNGVRIAFENCDMDGDWDRGDWNIAHNPTAWEMMYNEIPMDNIGLQWEPCHQMVSLIDPIPQLRKWVDRVFCVHGKDATVNWDVVRQFGIHGPRQFAFHRTPGFGDSNWTDIITILRQGGFAGSIDIEGWHDPVYCGDLEMTGQVHALNYLKQCRGGTFVPNPE